MTARACDIAVSEMTGTPTERIEDYVLITWVHRDDGKHQLEIVARDQDWSRALRLLQRAVTDLEATS